MNPTALSLRMKIIGALIRAARLKAHQTIQDCAQVIGVSQEVMEQYELGEKMISLPELELLAYHLDISPDHFLGKELLPVEDGRKSLPDLATLMRIRHRMVGATVRQARLENGLTQEALAERLELDETQLEAYELGLNPVPLPTLEMLSGILSRSILEFLDQQGPVGRWNIEQRAQRDFQSLPVELQTFVSKPINRPYLELAERLSRMSVERLRAVAEGLLEITY